MSPTRVLVLTVWTVVGLAGCSRDETIFSDYKLYDLDGSNQAIMGNHGAVAATNVTAFATQYPLIFVEVGGKNPRNLDCSYKLIDTSKHSMLDLSAGTGNQQVAIAKIRAQRQGVVFRSCAVHG